MPIIFWIGIWQQPWNRSITFNQSYENNNRFPSFELRFIVARKNDANLWFCIDRFRNPWVEFSSPHDFFSTLDHTNMPHSLCESAIYSFETFFTIEKFDKWNTKMLFFSAQNDQKPNRETEIPSRLANLCCLCQIVFPLQFFFLSVPFEMFALRKSVDCHTVHDKTHDCFCVFFLHILVERNRVCAYLNTRAHTHRKMMSHYKNCFAHDFKAFYVKKTEYS